VKGEAEALAVRAQRCQSHYFSATPRTCCKNSRKANFKDSTGKQEKYTNSSNRRKHV